MTMPKPHYKLDHACKNIYTTDSSSISTILISSLIDRTLTLRFFYFIITRFDSSAAAGSRMATTRYRFTAHAQAGHVVTMCNLTLHFLCISSLDHQGSDNQGWTVIANQEFLILVTLNSIDTEIYTMYQYLRMSYNIKYSRSHRI